MNARRSTPRLYLIRGTDPKTHRPRNYRFTRTAMNRVLRFLNTQKER